MLQFLSLACYISLFELVSCHPLQISMKRSETVFILTISAVVFEKKLY